MAFKNRSYAGSGSLVTRSAQCEEGSPGYQMARVREQSLSGHRVKYHAIKTDGEGGAPSVEAYCLFSTHPACVPFI